MALASASHGAGGGSRIADFWRISAVFDPIRGGPEPRTADQIQLAGQLAGIQLAGIQLAGDRKAGLFSGYRGPVKFRKVYRQLDHGPRAGMFGAWTTGRGPASLTAIYGDLNGQQRA